ncbi:conjugal transfer protein TraL [Pseudoflavonifractor sp. 524-17]|uniref:conjugal transfer protein TraL n=1 Tax=Pseudoflavonifractor sp. 524-17 TaxID=2304577 RepID=UPI0013799B1F|nr:conjugal transfer protein TraL [Pseudoflavonifractor sp. 524-17]NCE65725.1 conjugal transfer protein TraL [Pseudoflavonifractor sp. 524-17]
MRSISPAAALWPAACGVLSLITLFAVLSLEQGGLGVHLWVGAVLLLLAGLALYLLFRSGCRGQLLWMSLVPIALAFLLRALALDHISYDYRDFLSHWAAFFRENGGFSAVKLPIGDYNAPYLYFMAAISYLPFPDLYAIKLFSILFDVLLAWGGLRLTQALQGREAGPAPLAVFHLLLLLPTVVLNGAFWGQCDSLYGALVLHALAFVFTDRPRASVALLAVAFSFKLQTIFLIPLWGILWFLRRVKFFDLLLFPAVYALTVLPALLLGKPLKDILGVYFQQASQYTHALVFNAPTVFSLIPHGADTTSPLLPKLGIAAAFLLCFFVMGWLFLCRDRAGNEAILAGAAVLALGIPFLLPYMHERYFFLADLVTLIWAARSPRHLPIALLTQLASFGSYCVYLRLKYTLVISLAGRTWVMAGEALVMLAALILALAAFLSLTAGSEEHRL